MKNKLFLGLLSVLLFLAIGVGLFTRFSFIEEDVNVASLMQKENQIRVQLMEDPQFVSIYFNNQLKDFSQLKDQSDIIVKVKVTNDRENHFQAILSKVRVTKVYKGEVKQGDSIYLYEPSSFHKSESYSSTGGYNIMLDNQEYIVFLNHLKKPEGYQYKDREAISFVPISSYFGKYPVNSKEITPLISKEIETSDIETMYSKVKDYDILTTQNEMLKKYQSFKNEALNMK